MKRYFVFLAFICQALAAQINTPYPETIDLRQINSSGKERARLAQWWTQFDRQPTGFFIEAGKEIVINVEILTPAADGAVPRITIGTPGFHFDGRLPEGAYPPRESDIRPGRLALAEGINRITPNYSGLIYFSFVTGEAAEPTGIAQITFTAESQHVRAPRFVFGVTSDAEFEQMMNLYQTADVIFHSDYAVVAAARKSALSVSLSQNKNEWFEALHNLIEVENTFGGIDKNDPNPVHHPLKGGEVRYLLAENLSTAVAHASNEYTGYNSENNTGMGFLRVDLGEVAHEIGHQSQQPAYLIDGAIEGSVHQYVAVVNRAREANPTRVSEWTWGIMQSFWSDPFVPVSRLRYEMSETEIHDLLRYSAVINYTQFIRMVWEQLYLIFGDEFYQRLHRITREEGEQGGNNIHSPSATEREQRRAYLIWKASQITGYDLTDYFNHWGIRVTDSREKALLRARIYTALVNGEIEPLPYPITDVLSVSGQQIPDWAPLPLKGITASMPKEEILEMEKTSLLTPEPYQFRVTIEANDGVVISQKGVIDADEDREFLIDFTLVSPQHILEVVVDGAPYEPEKNGDVYTIRQFVTNHCHIFIFAAVPLSDDVELAEILVDNKPAVQSDDNPLIYRITIDFTTHVALSAQTAHPGATIDESDLGVKQVQEGINRYYIRVYAEDGFTTVSYRLDISVNDDPNKTHTGIYENFRQRVKIYPNPVLSGQTLFIEIPCVENLKGVMKISAADGKLLEQKTISNVIETIAMNYAPGVYFMHIRTDDENRVFKIVIQ